jgi:L-threonylcarbamoyladenylate synthase
VNVPSSSSQPSSSSHLSSSSGLDQRTNNNKMGSRVKPENDDSICKAISIINSGGVVAFPTETVYGLGADATNELAARKIYELKSRPSNNPIIVHVASIEEARKIGEFNELAEVIAANFWPGPITIVVPRKVNSGICSTVSAGLSSIGIRIPANEMALELIKKTGKPIAAPSANISNYVSPTEASHVIDAFGDKVYVLDGGKATYGLESTIIDVTTNVLKLLRYGFITPEIISKVTGLEVNIANTDKILAPGMMKKHYSPNVKLRMNATELKEEEVGLGFGSNNIGQLNLSPKGDLAEAAANLYSMLRILDKKAADSGAKLIAVASIPNTGIGLAINDKLTRASS